MVNPQPQYLFCQGYLREQYLVLLCFYCTLMTLQELLDHYYGCLLIIVLDRVIDSQNDVPSFNKILTDYWSGYKCGNLDLMYQNVL